MRYRVTFHDGHTEECTETQLSSYRARDVVAKAEELTVEAKSVESRVPVLETPTPEPEQTSGQSAFEPFSPRKK